MNTYTIIKGIIVFWFAMTIHLSGTGTALAHGTGGILQAGNRPVGEYTLYAWTSPTALRVGESHLEVLLLNRDSKPVYSSEVELIITSSADGRVQRLDTSAAVEGEQIRHEGIVYFANPGNYTVEVIVSEDDRHIGSTNFTFSVVSSLSWGRLSMNGIILSLVVVGCLWFTRQDLGQDLG